MSDRDGQNDPVLIALRQGPCFGLDLLEQTGLKPGKLYETLTRLEEAAVIEADWVTTTPGAPRRRRYHLADSGDDQP
jgi:DNA-binding MarR family transcriptional regulator